jgi:hypothetical protein
LSKDAEAYVLAMIPEPVLTPGERAALSELYRDPTFWEWFESQPEPADVADKALHEAGHR